jgi:hypothetical protein
MRLALSISMLAMMASASNAQQASALAPFEKDLERTASACLSSGLNVKSPEYLDCVRSKILVLQFEKTDQNPALHAIGTSRSKDRSVNFTIGINCKKGHANVVIHREDKKSLDSNNTRKLNVTYGFGNEGAFKESWTLVNGVAIGPGVEGAQQFIKRAAVHGDKGLRFAFKAIINPDTIDFNQGNLKAASQALLKHCNI